MRDRISVGGLFFYEKGDKHYSRGGSTILGRSWRIGVGGLIGKSHLGRTRRFEKALGRVTVEEGASRW